jgi:uncharacterized protein YdhG (YjbR/CyaY superfamily)
MPVPDPGVDAYVEQLDGRRREAVRTLRRLCLQHLPRDFTEVMRYGMPGYVREGGTEGVGFAAQKQYISFYVTRTDVLDAHRDRLAGLSVGKSCIRYRRPEQIDEDVVRSVLEMTVATRGPIC